jgi:hypothetical protein
MHPTEQANIKIARIEEQVKGLNSKLNLLLSDMHTLIRMQSMIERHDHILQRLEQEQSHLKLTVTRDRAYLMGAGAVLGMLGGFLSSLIRKTIGG